ncbi:S8 family serine peptidase [Bacillus sp. E214]|uniref:S8 family peptidase n=1 Tax=Bacillus sp. E214 TaxID=2587156 RepID=UPI0011DF9C9A|nr:S8 family serine peptidase [Bacillus sp. E214]
MKKIVAVIAATALLLTSGTSGVFAAAKVSSINQKGDEIRSSEKIYKPTTKKYDEYIQADTLVIKHSGSLSKKTLTKYKGKVMKAGGNLGYSVVKFKTASAAKQAYTELSKSNSVTSISPSVKYKTSSVKTDPKISQQYYNKLLNLPVAQKKAGKNKVLVAVIDTGIDKNHPELKNKIVSSYNVHNPVNASLPEDHGTHVAGIIAAEKNNGIGGYGINPNASVLSIDVFNREWGAYDYNIAEGVLYAIKKKAKVINLSLGGPFSSPVLEAAIKKAKAAGIVIVAAAGNEGSDMKGYPAAYEGVISVGAVNKSKTLTSWSSYGVSTDLVAPGDNVYAPIYDYEKKSTFASFSGTSMAAPMVTGTVSLLLSKYPKLKPEQVEYILKKTATDLSTKGYDKKYGYGLINPSSALSFDIKKIPSLTTAVWNKDTIMKSAKTVGSSYTVKKTFMKPLEQHWIKHTVKKGETYQINLMGSKVFDSQLLVNMYGKDKSSTKKIDDVTEGKTEGYYFKAPYDGTLTVGVKDISGNYDVAGSKLSEYELVFKKVTVSKDESGKENPIIIPKLSYDTTGKKMHLVGENGDDDYFQFTTGEKEENIKLSVNGTPGADVSMFVYALTDIRDEEELEEKEEITEGEGMSKEADGDIEDGNSEEEPTHVNILEQEINSGTIGESEQDVFTAEPKTTYTIKISNKYEGYSESFFDFFILSEGFESSATKITGAIRQNGDPYIFKASLVKMPADEDGIHSIYDRDEEYDEEEEYVGDDEEYWEEEGDDEVIEMLNEMAIPYKLTSEKSGYLQSRYDEDWYKVNVTSAGIHAFDLGTAKHSYSIYQVVESEGEDGNEIRLLEAVADNYDPFTGKKLNTFYASLEAGKTYYMKIEMDWMSDSYSTDKYFFESRLVGKPADKYENNDSMKNVKTLPGTTVKGDYAKLSDTDLFRYTAKASGNYALTVDNNKPSTPGLPALVKGDVYSYIAVMEDKNNNKNVDDADLDTIKYIDSYYDPAGAYGSHYFQKGKAYFIAIMGDGEYLPFSLTQYTFKLSQVNHKDEDAGTVIKKNKPSKPISFKKSKGKWEKTGRFNAFNTKKNDEDWYKLKVDKAFSGQITLSGGRELDGAFEVYQNGKKIAGSDRYAGNDTEVLNISLKKGTYYIKLKDAQGSASLSPYTIRVQEKK